jgi:hypothetical protein
MWSPSDEKSIVLCGNECQARKQKETERDDAHVSDGNIVGYDNILQLQFKLPKHENTWSHSKKCLAQFHPHVAD